MCFSDASPTSTHSIRLNESTAETSSDAQTSLPTRLSNRLSKRQSRVVVAIHDSGNSLDTFIPSPSKQPPLHQDVHDTGLGTVAATAQFVLALVGAGILALPAVMRMLGWLPGLMVIVLFGFITFFSLEMLIVSNVRRYPSYMHAVRDILGPRAAWLVLVAQQMGLLLGALLYAIGCGQALESIVQACIHVPAGSLWSNTWVYMLFAALPPLLIVHAPTLAKLWLVCVLGAVAVVTYVIAIVVYGILNAQPSTYGTLAGAPQGTTPTMQLLYVFVALANVAGSYTLCKLTVEIQAGVKAAPLKTNVKRTTRSMGGAVFFGTLLYLVVAITGYISTGGNCDNVMECMTNNRVITIIGNACVFFSLTVTFVLNVVPVTMSAERPFQLLPALQPYISFIRPLLRVVIVGALYTVAALLPDFAPAAGMMGAVDFYPLSVLIPSLLWVKTQGPLRRRTLVGLILGNVLACVVSVGGGVACIAAWVLEVRGQNV